MNMASAIYSAAMIDAETGGNETYRFKARPDLLEMPVPDIIDAFIKHLDSEGIYPSPMSYELDSAVKRKNRRIVLATGSLILGKGDQKQGEIPFLLMISPDIREQLN